MPLYVMRVRMIPLPFPNVCAPCVFTPAAAVPICVVLVLMVVAAAVAVAAAAPGSSKFGAVTALLLRLIEFVW